MQIIIIVSILLVIATVVIYKINERFEKREFYILLLTIFMATIGFLYYENKKDNYLPNMFIEKYEQEHKTKIKSLDYELLNNKVVSSKDKFVYKFIYTVLKEDSEFLCSIKDVEIHKIRDEYIFVNFDSLKEECFKK
ncbi:hypothetical protein CRU87_06620 [Aliarcobacter trophiarum LMG 25534]|uniref:Membrane protein n=1 Tax=Aliarcobacter trophiarum LMG 25534 TaxID=1032241 RepID=A0AAD0QJ17_9BACT|nr:hypothetical protein [Aliarcobacter trophiarum]AXK48611.1 putative membrane protein [Aliarcobacter trophiarum LMG 25534]RXI27666.1 hypothetical protein CRU89_05155 [Aliarcobacter trophiarum]RXJ91058.1 hypothetical protein CRU87_06620 [Aliarcobacter trophiarum LMG 25534]